ncbi:MAG: arsenate reductase family protein [Candidatus Melainabacteria bacterium]
MAKVVIERMYGLPYCSTCVKAETFLKDYGATVKRFINVKEEAVTKKELQELAALLGGVDKLFSKRAMKYRAMGLDKMTLSDGDMLKHMQEEYTFIKRPTIVTSDGRALSGFSEKQYKALLGI